MYDISLAYDKYCERELDDLSVDEEKVAQECDDVDLEEYFEYLYKGERE